MNSLDIILAAAPWIVGLSFLTFCWWFAVELDAAKTITPDHPEAVTGLDRLQAGGSAAYAERGAA